MKLVKVLDQKSTPLAMDPLNQVILRELVTTESAISDLAAKLNLSTLNVWRRMQKLQKADLVEQTATQKVGNIEKKFYRSTAAWFAPQQLFNYKPKDPSLNEAFEIYTNIQSSMMAILATYNDVPKNADPVDYSLFMNMQVFAQICGKPEVQAKIVELKEKLARFNQQSGAKVF
jgi:DNA-binding Lrp family transcriptional regulator